MTSETEPGAPAPTISRPSPSRSIGFSVLFTLCVLYLIRPLLVGIPQADEAPQQGAPEGFTTETFIASTEAKLNVGIFELLDYLEGMEEGALESVIEQNRSDIKQQLERAERGHQTLAANLRVLILYEHLGWEEGAERIRSRIGSGIRGSRFSDAKTTETIAPVQLALYDLYMHGEPLDAGEFEAAEGRLGFHGELARLYNLELQDDPAAAALEEQIAASALRTGIAYGLFGFALLCLIGLGLVLFLIYFVQLRSGKLHFRFKPPSLPYHLMFETFTLYLLLMVLAKEFGQRIGTTSIVISFFLELLVPVLALYPFIFGAKARDLAADLGLHRGGGFFKEIILGPAAYATMIPFVIASAVISMGIYRGFGGDPTSGAHPIAPLLGNEETPMGVILMIVFLAVVAAPVIEEIMFRGYFYRALRARFGWVPAALVSSVLFAAIHPQGFLGILPLSTIALGFAILREWRDSLVAPIFAHACVNGVTVVILLTLMR